jgi:hypothetical protein
LRRHLEADLQTLGKVYIVRELLDKNPLLLPLLVGCLAVMSCAAVVVVAAVVVMWFGISA